MIEMDRREVKTALKRMAFYYLLLAVCTVLYALIPDRFPARNISTPFLLTLSVCLVLYYSHRVSPTGVLSAMMKAISWMALLLILLRGIKYSVFKDDRKAQGAFRLHSGDGRQKQQEALALHLVHMQQIPDRVVQKTFFFHDPGEGAEFLLKSFRPVLALVL